GLANRRAWERAIQAASASHLSPCSVIIVDLDRLKETNDSYGHATGDQLITALAALITASTPDEALAARIGGDEFALLLPHTDETACQALVNQLNTQLRHHPPVGPLPLSASIGHATTPPAANLHKAIRLADSRMYITKHKP